MRSIVLSEEIKTKYNAYRFTYNNRTVYLVLQLIFFVLSIAFVWYCQYIGIEHLEINFFNNDIRLHIFVFSLWFLIILMKFIIHFSAVIPGLSKLDDYLERREMNKIRSTYEYQMKYHGRN